MTIKRVTTRPLRLTPYAWAKLLRLRDLGDTEVGGFGAHLPSHSSVLQLPAASQTQLRSTLASQPQTLSGGGVGAVGSFVTGVPPALQPQPVQVISQ